MIGVHCQLVICRGHIWLLKNIFCKFLRLTLLWENWPEMQFSQFFMICGPIWKCWKWVTRSKILSEVNLKCAYGFLMWNQENFYQGALRSKFVAPFSEWCLPYGPLVVNFNKCHLTLTGLVHRFRICKIFFFTLSISRDINNKVSEIEGAITSLILVRFGHALYGWKGNFMLISNLCSNWRYGQ